MAAETLYNVYQSSNYSFYYVALVDDRTTIAKERNRDYCFGIFKIRAFPTVYFDGGYINKIGEEINVEQTESAIEQAEQRTTRKPITMESSVTWNDNAKLTVTVIITNQGNSLYLGKIRSYVTEIESRWIDESGDPYHFGFLDYALNKVKENIKKYNQEVSKKSTVLLKCYEQLAKEITRCEHKINENISDPQKIERNVEAMKKQQKYWKAYKEVKRALIEDATPDASKIIEHANSYQKLLDDYKLQLKEVDNFAEIDVEKYQKNKLENEKLITDNKKVTQENEENKSILYLLSYHRNYKRIIRKTRYSLSPIIRV